MSLPGPEPSFRVRLDEDDPLPPEDHYSHARMSRDVDLYYRGSARRLIGQLARKIGCGDAAREVVHDAVVRMLGRSVEKQARVRRIDAYIAETSRNLVTDKGRSVNRFGRLLDDVRAEGYDLHDQVVFLETRDTLRRLEQALLKLKPKTRKIFLAHRLDGLSYAEIAVQTGLSIKGVEKQMAKAIAKLSHFLDRS